MPATLLITLIGIAGAAAGVLVVSRTTSLRRLVPFSSGLLAGMAALLILPEALEGVSGWIAALLCLAGWGVFAGIESTVHRLSEAPHAQAIGLLPILIAVGLHNVLDGWNIAVASQLNAPALGSLLAGMALHKLTAGFATGAIFRAGSTQRRAALAAATACEAATAAGAAAQWISRSQLGDGWTAPLLALTAGSFLYLGYHALSRSRRDNSPASAAVSALAGFAAAWILAALGHGM